MALKTHGITSATPQNLLFGAGAYYKNLKWGKHYEIVAQGTDGAKKVVQSGEEAETVLLSEVQKTCPEAQVDDYVKEEEGFYGVPLGATSGGGGLSISPEYSDPDMDGATVPVKGLKNKVAEAASMKMNLTEYREGTFIDVLHLVKDETKKYTGFTAYKTKKVIGDDDYLENVAFVGKLNDGRYVIVIMENALCASAFEPEFKNKELSVFEAEFTCHADLKQDDLTTLPIQILFPTTPIV